MSGDQVFPPPQNGSSCLHLGDTFLPFPVWTWHINKLVTLLSHKSQSSGSKGIEMWLFHRTTRRLTPSCWDCVYQSWPFKHFYLFKPNCFLLLKTIDTPPLAFNCIKTTQTQSMICKHHTFSLHHVDNCLRLATVNRNTFGYRTLSFSIIFRSDGEQ